MQNKVSYLLEESAANAMASATKGNACASFLEENAMKTFARTAFQGPAVKSQTLAKTASSSASKSFYISEQRD